MERRVAWLRFYKSRPRKNTFLHLIDARLKEIGRNVKWDDKSRRFVHNNCRYRVFNLLIDEALGVAWWNI